LGVALVTAPWAARTSSVAGELLLVQGYSAASFYPTTRLDIDQRDQNELWPRLRAEDPNWQEVGRASTPPEVMEADRRLRAAAIENIRRDPAAYVASRLRLWPQLVLTSFDSFTGINTSF